MAARHDESGIREALRLLRLDSFRQDQTISPSTLTLVNFAHQLLGSVEDVKFTQSRGTMRIEVKLGEEILSIVNKLGRRMHRQQRMRFLRCIVKFLYNMHTIQKLCVKLEKNSRGSNDAFTQTAHWEQGSGNDIEIEVGQYVAAAAPSDIDNFLVFPGETGLGEVPSSLSIGLDRNLSASNTEQTQTDPDLWDALQMQEDEEDDITRLLELENAAFQQTVEPTGNVPYETNTSTINDNRVETMPTRESVSPTSGGSMTGYQVVATGGETVSLHTGEAIRFLDLFHDDTNSLPMPMEVSETSVCSTTTGLMETSEISSRKSNSDPMEESDFEFEERQILDLSHETAGLCPVTSCHTIYTHDEAASSASSTKCLPTDPGQIPSEITNNNSTSNGNCESVAMNEFEKTYINL